MEQKIMVKSPHAEPADSRRGDRRLAIIDAAESLFLEQGYERTSLATIIKKSGGSLATVYDLFGNKQGLLRAVVERRRDDALGDVGGIACEMDSRADMLKLYAHRLHGHMTAPRSIALIRVVMTESMRDPEFAREFHDTVHLSFVRDIAKAFADWALEGRAVMDDPAAAAEFFLALILSDVQLRAMAGDGAELLDEGRIDWRLQSFFDYFKIV